MTETFPRGNCENKKMGTKIIKQDICKPIYHGIQVQRASGSGRAGDREWVIGLPGQDTYSCSLPFSRCLSLRPNGNDAVKLIFRLARFIALGVLVEALDCKTASRAVDICADFGRPDKPAAPSSYNLLFDCVLSLSERGRVVGVLLYVPLGRSPTAPGNGGGLWSRGIIAEEREPSVAPAVVGRAGDLGDLGGSKS